MAQVWPWCFDTDRVVDRRRIAAGQRTLAIHLPFVTTGTKSIRFRKAATSYLSSLWSRREFAWYMAMGNLRARNASTALGLFWWVLNPLLMGFVYYLVFGIILEVSRDLSYLLSGIFVFYFTSTAITTGANAIIQNRTLLVNLQFPRLIMPITALIETAVGFLASIPAFYAIIILQAALDGKVSWTTMLPPMRFIVLFPIAFAIQSVYNVGMASISGAVTVPFRDINNLLPHLLRIWLYLSPILYSVDKFKNLPPIWRDLIYLNPMIPLLGLYRSALLGYKFFPADILWSGVWAIVAAGVGITLFVRFEGKMARYL